MCLKELLKLFQKPKPDNSQYDPMPLKIPHPEEPMNPLATMESVNVGMLRLSFYLQYNVPESSYPFFDAIPISLSEVPQCAWMIDNRIEVNPKYANAGVLAHEICHVVWATLTEQQKTDFQTAYNAILAVDPLMVLLDKQNSYMNTNIIEAYAECFRYLGQSLPDVLRKYYPLLF